jgi:LacI family transcriptional regulator
MARPSRMTDVVEAAGVSTMTVSRVLKAHPIVSEEARRKVLAAVERLHCELNELARSVREQRSRQIGVLVLKNRAEPQQIKVLF